VLWPGRRLSRRARSALLLGLLLIVAFGPFVAAITAQPASRIALTAALSEHHTVDIHGYPLGTDRATYNGRLRSDKAPGEPLLAVPVYLVGRALGAQSEAHLRQDGNLGAWWVTFWTSFVPFVALILVMYLVASRYAPPLHAMAAAVALGLGTMMLPLSVNLYGASLAALAAFGAWAVLDRGSPSAARLLGAGALAGVSVATEYETGIVLVVLAVVVINRAHMRAAWFALGAAVPLIVAGLYQWVAFGKPWRTAHAYYRTAAIRRQIVGFSFGWRGINATFFGPHSLLQTNPIVLVALTIAAVAARGSTADVRRHARIALAVTVPYLVLCCVWRGTPALEEPGPRYMIPAIPFLVVPLAAAWARLWRPAVLAALWGAYIAIAASVTFLLLGIDEPAIHRYTTRLTDHAFSPTLWSMAFGRFGFGVYALTVVAAGAAFTMHMRRDATARPVS
jgi:hypothetical protein